MRQRGAGSGASPGTASSNGWSLTSEPTLFRLAPLPAPRCPSTTGMVDRTEPGCRPAAGGRRKGEGLPPLTASYRPSVLHSDLAVCVWIPRFALRCEEQRRPNQARLPTVLLAPDDLRRVWQVGSFARRTGVRPGMTVSQAIGLCPALVLWEPDPVYYDEQFSRLLVLLNDVSPVIEPVELGRVFVGVDGLEGLYGSPEEQVEAIRSALGEAGKGKREGRATCSGKCTAKWEQGEGSGASIGSAHSGVSALATETVQPRLVPLPALRSPHPSAAGAVGGKGQGCPSATGERRKGEGLPPGAGWGWEKVARLGWAHGKFAAWVASTKAKPGGCFIVTSRDRVAFLASQPIGVLPMSPDTHRRLIQLNIKLVGDLTRLPEVAVISQFGKEGRSLWQLAVGNVVDSVVGRETPEPILSEMDFPNPVSDRSVLDNALDRLVKRALHHPRRQGWRVLEVTARAKQEHGASWAIRITLKDPSANKQRICTPLKTRLEQMPPNGAVETLTVEFTTFVRGTDELQLFARDADSAARAGRQRALRAAVSEMKTRFKHSTMYHVVEVQPRSRLPERRYALVDFDP